MTIRDIELASGGLLVGRLLDAGGQPRGNVAVSIVADGAILATTHTDEAGIFAVTNLRGGVHQVSTGDAIQICRFWVNGTAPPLAARSVDFVSGDQVVRGQWGPPPGNSLIRRAKVWATNPFIVGGVVAAAVAVPVALSDDDGPHS
jgi:hypothetical protein